MCFAAIGIIGSLIGGVVQAAGAMQAGKAQEAQYKAQAKYKKRQAILEEIQGGWESYKVEQKSQEIASSQEAGFAASGVEGQSVSDTIRTSLTEADKDKQAIAFGATARAGNYRYQAKIYEMQAKQAKQAGMINAFGAIVSTGTQLMGSFS